MSEIDLVILALLFLAALVGAARGFLREAVSLLVWLAAILITLIYTSRLSLVLPIDMVSSSQTRATIGAVVLFTGTLLVGNLCSWLIGRFVARKKLTPPDRVIGSVFAVARAIVMLTLLVLSANLVPDLRQSAWWKESSFMPAFQGMAQFIHARLPEGTWQYFDFPPTGN